MIDIILKISGAIIVFNVIILLVPYGKFEKYISLITGLLIVLVVISTFGEVSIDRDFYISGEELSYDSSDLESKLKYDIEYDLEQKYLNHTSFKEDIISIDVKANETIENVTIKLKSFKNQEEIINEASTFYDIKKAFVVIE